MGNKFPIGGSKGVNVCSGGVFWAGGFCVEWFTIYKIEDKFPNGADKLPVYGIDGYL